MAENIKPLLNDFLREVMLNGIAIYHAAIPVFIAFIVFHQDKVMKGDLSIFTTENIVALLFNVVITAWKTKGQRAAQPINLSR